MYKMRLVVLTLFLCGFCQLFAQDSGSSFKMTPPPVPCLKFFPGVKQFSITGTHYTMGEMEGQSGMSGSPVAMGVNINYAFSSKRTLLGAQNGAILSLAYMNVSMPLKLTETSENTLSTNAYNLGIHWVLDLVNGEKRDIAGEIISRKPTVAAFLGAVLNYMPFNMGPLYEPLGYTEDIISKTLTSNYSVGLAADIPLGFVISLVPYIRYTSSQVSTTMMAPGMFNPAEVYEQTFTSSYDFMDYGTDIDIRLFRNAPDWVISLGMAMAQIEGLQNGNRLITLSIKHEIGKHYSNTLIGPALH
ncbi:MAG: hypothetical protein JSW33_02840 [bacterium]|nr:MAG: hypothetical protein JSW33_02840 [bacterium]